MTTKPANKETATLARDLLKVCEALELRYSLRKPSKPTDFIEALVYQILELGNSEKAARDALRRLREEYIDWNDARVATVREIEDILGQRFYQVREKSEDIRHLLADFYTAFRTMNLGSQLTPEGIETLLALPETTNVRKDMVERALVLCHETSLFPCDEDQFQLLKFLSGYFKNIALTQGQRKIEETLDIEQMLRLSRGLREHVHVYQLSGEDEPQIIAFGWDQPDPLKMDKGKKPVAKVDIKVESKPKPKPKPEPEPKAEKPAPEPVEKPKPETKPISKPDIKTISKQPGKPELKPINKTEVKPGTAHIKKPEATKPEVAQAEESKPEIKKAEKPKVATKEVAKKAPAQKAPAAKDATKDATKAKTGSHKADAGKKKK